MDSTMKAKRACGCGPNRICPSHDKGANVPMILECPGCGSNRPWGGDPKNLKVGYRCNGMNCNGNLQLTPQTKRANLDAETVFDVMDALDEQDKNSKPSNPKDLIGSSKLSISMVPFPALAHWASAHMEGNVKYGRFNWRAVGVRSSIYIDAALRHLMKYTDGEDKDPETRVHHLASVMACCAIILDAGACGKLTDDRPPSAPTSELVDDELRKVSEHLKELHSDKAPYHYTIEDTP